MSLEAVSDVSSYEVEVTRGSGQFFKRFKFKKNEFSLPLKVGRYLLRTRSLDVRSISGPWSDWEQIVVPPPKIEFETKHQQSLTASDKSLSAELQLKWKGSADVEKYKLSAFSDDGQKVFEKETAATEMKFDLPPGHYKIQLSSVVDGIESDEKAEYTIQVLGAKLTPVEISDVQMIDGSLQISWNTKAPNAFYSGQLERQDIGVENNNEWETVLEFENQNLNFLKLSPDLMPGNYRLSVSTAAKGWRASPVSSRKFMIKPLERSLSSIQDEIKTDFDFSKISN